jgi:hypothetical protein
MYDYEYIWIYICMNTNIYEYEYEQEYGIWTVSDNDRKLIKLDSTYSLVRGTRFFRL